MKSIDQQKKEQLKIGLSALSKCIKTKTDVPNAFMRIGIGYITLKYGIPGDSNKFYLGGYGISHIIEKRDSETNDGLAVAKKLIDVLIFGEIVRTDKTKKTAEILRDGYLAILSLEWSGKNISWLLTGYKLTKKKL